MEDQEAVVAASPDVIEYDALVNELSETLVRRYGSLAEFTRHADFLELGFSLNDSERVQTYFARPKGEGKRKTKSASIMCQLAQKYLGKTVEVKTVITKTQVLYEK